MSEQKTHEHEVKGTAIPAETEVIAPLATRRHEEPWVMVTVIVPKEWIINAITFLVIFSAILVYSLLAEE